MPFDRGYLVCVSVVAIMHAIAPIYTGPAWNYIRMNLQGDTIFINLIK